MTVADARDFAEEWIAAWNAHDLDRIVAHYAPEIVFLSPQAVKRTGNGRVVGVPALRDYWGPALAAQTDLKFELIDVLTGFDCVTVLPQSSRPDGGGNLRVRTGRQGCQFIRVLRVMTVQHSEKPPIVFIHGMCCTPQMWSNYAAYFSSRGFSVYVPALPCHDISSDAEPPAELAKLGLLDYAAALERYLASISDSPVLVGHSMGGLLAQMLAARGLVRAIVLVSPAPPAGVFALRLAHIPMVFAMLLKWRFWQRPLRPAFWEARWSLLNRVSLADARAVYAQFVYDSGRALFEMALWPFDTKHASRVEAAKVVCPVLAIAGTADRVTPPSVVRRIARRYGQQAAYAEFPGHAHWMLGEAGWEVIAERCCQWISALDGELRTACA